MILDAMLPSEKITLYYFSGTGNAKAVAGWIEEEAKQKGVEIEVLNLAQTRRKGLATPASNQKIGFLSPTHGFNFPPIMLHFLFRFPKGNGNRVFVMNTRAGMKLGRFFLPGLSGMTLYLSALILLLKGYRIQALKAVDLPSNWISVHPGLRQKVIDSMKEKRKLETKTYAQKLVDGKQMLRGLYSLPVDLLITPIGILYYLLGRFFLAKTFIASKDCTACGLCDQSCPIGAIKVVDNRRFWTYKCENCMQCMNQCPERAIETAHGFVAFAIFVPETIVLFILSRVLNIEAVLLRLLPQLMVSIIMSLMEVALMMSVVFLGYRLMHFLMRFSLFERIFVLTSLTHWKFWRRYHFSGRRK